MRIKAKQNGLTVHEIAGSYVVILGLNLIKVAIGIASSQSRSHYGFTSTN